MADLPDPITLKDTPLVNANIPALDMLARIGDLSALPVNSSSPVSHKNALINLLGFDLQKGEPFTEELMEFGLDNSSAITGFKSLKPFVIPGFSGHGVCITTSAWVRGLAKCALLKPRDIYSPGSSDAEILETMASLVCEAITVNEFVFVYVDTPLRASLKGDYDRKIQSLESIDRHLIAPVADFVWKSELMINMAVTTDLVTPWHRKRPAMLSVPVVLYFNNNNFEEDQRFSFTEVQAMLGTRHFNSSSALIKYLSSFHVEEDNPDEETL